MAFAFGVVFSMLLSMFSMIAVLFLHRARILAAGSRRGGVGGRLGVCKSGDRKAEYGDDRENS